MERIVKSRHSSKGSTRSNTAISPRRTITDELRVQIAERRFAHGQVTEITELARIFDRAPAVISRAIKDAFMSGLVEVRRCPRVITPRLSTLEQQIRQLYPALLNALVIDSGEGTDSDTVHTLLGHTMANHLAEGYLRDRDVIALSGGRAVYHTVDALRRLGPLQIKDVTLLSLCGAVHPKHDADTVNLRLDADTNVNYMGPVFSGRVDMQMVSYPIGFRDESVFEKSCIGGCWPEQGPNLALMGVGVLWSGHRLVQIGSRNAIRPENQLLLSEKLRKQVIDLIDVIKVVCDRSKEPMYYPVAELAQHLFFVPPPVGVSVSKEVVDQLQNIIDIINENSLSISGDKLHKVGAIALIAGTRVKAAALRQLLKNSGYPIRFLCIDREVAEYLIREM